MGSERLEEIRTRHTEQRGGTTRLYEDIAYLLRLLDRERDVAERLATQVGEESRTGGNRRSWRVWAEGASRSIRPDLWADGNDGNAPPAAR